MRNFIIEVRNQSMRLIGPFDSQDAAAEWGRSIDNNPDDDPRWQTVELANVVGDSFAIPVVAP